MGGDEGGTGCSCGSAMSSEKIVSGPVEANAGSVDESPLPGTCVCMGSVYIKDKHNPKSGSLWSSVLPALEYSAHRQNQCTFVTIVYQDNKS